MGGFIRLSLSLFIGILLSLNIFSVSAQKIKYSIPPHCDKNNEVTCKINEHYDNKEIAVCIKLGSSVQIQEDLHYISGCNSGSPECINENTRVVAPEDVVIECIEFIQCQDNVAHCSDGKIAKCLGNGNELKGCNCNDGSNPICDYTWEISNEGSYQ